MKIRVGETYKDKEGRSVYIEHQLTKAVNNTEAGDFLGILSNGGFNWYNVSGVCNKNPKSNYTLVPKTKVGYVGIGSNGLSGHDYSTYSIFDTEEAAIAACRNTPYTRIAKIEYEDED